MWGDAGEVSNGRKVLREDGGTLFLEVTVKQQEIKVIGCSAGNSQIAWRDSRFLGGAENSTE